MPMLDKTAIRSGLFTTRESPVALTGVAIDAELTNFCARVVVSQRYVNQEATPIEAVYVFPLDEGAAVCGFEAIVDGTLVIGEIKEREEAFKAYDDAMARGDGAFLLDEERPDVFQASVGNLPPGKEILLRVTYVTELAVDERGLRFLIPTTVSPRYAPVEDQRGVGRSDAEALNPPRGWRVPYGLNLSVRLRMPGTIAKLESPSHPISVTMNDREATVSLSQRSAPLDRDFVLTVETTGLDVPQAWIERDGDDLAIAVGFAPQLGDTPVPGEILFVVDRSGSMGGTSIEEVRNALQLCLRSLIPGCCFNIIGFGSTYQSLFPKPRPYDDDSLAAASAHVRDMQADLGGTEILPVLTFVLDQPRGTLPRAIVLLTDGEVTNTDAIIALARARRAGARIFTFGIGAGASHHLVNGVARSGDGVAEHIYPGERIEPKVLRQFGRLLSPSLTHVSVDWDGLTVTQAPAKVPPIFSHDRLVLYGFVKDLRSATVRLNATRGSAPVVFDVPIDPARATSGRTVATLAARLRIRELEESPEWTMARGSRQRDRQANRVTQEIVALSVRYGIVSRETSFVAIERRETPVDGDVQLRRIPIALTSGWGGLEESAHMVDASRMASLHAGGLTLGAGSMPAGIVRRTVSALSHLGSSGAPPTDSASAPSLERNLRMRWPLAANATPPAVRAPRGLHGLVALQRADGSWDLTPEFAAILGHRLADLESAFNWASSHGEERRAWATALALVWLDQHAGEVGDEWRLLANKARGWLNKVAAAPPASGQTWIHEAEAFMRPRA
jgi:Ca-activated chloride channel homolog